MTRATRNRVEQRLKRKGEKSPFDAGYARGWAQGRVQLANMLASPEGLTNTENGDVFHMVKFHGREMTLADIVDPWIWSVEPGHNGQPLWQHLPEDWT